MFALTNNEIELARLLLLISMDAFGIISKHIQFPIVDPGVLHSPIRLWIERNYSAIFNGNFNAMYSSITTLQEEFTRILGEDKAGELFVWCNSLTANQRKGKSLIMAWWQLKSELQKGESAVVSSISDVSRSEMLAVEEKVRHISLAISTEIDAIDSSAKSLWDAHVWFFYNGGLEYSKIEEFNSPLDIFHDLFTQLHNYWIVVTLRHDLNSIDFEVVRKFVLDFTSRPNTNMVTTDIAQLNYDERVFKFSLLDSSQ